MAGCKAGKENHMKKKRICAAVIAFCLIVLYGIRVYAVNADVKLPIRQVFQKGEVVSFGKDYNISTNDRSQGYTIQVLDSKIMTAKDFCQKYKIDDMGLVKYYYMVKLSVKNVSNKNAGKEGVALGIAMLVGTDYTLIASPEENMLMNPELPPMLSFSLELGKRTELWIAYSLIPGATPSSEQILKDPPMLQITQYPHRKLLRLS